ncbi:PEP-CTERM sorting domain-containing protein [Colwellia sp. MEBiC06753]
MFKFIRQAALVTFSLLTAFSASANLISFNFESIPEKGQFDTLIYKQEGITLSITAFDSDGKEADVHRNADGLGVWSTDKQGRVANDEYLVFEITGPQGARFTDFNLFFPTDLTWGGNSFGQNEQASIDFGESNYQYTNTLNSNHQNMAFNTTLISGNSFIFSSSTADGMRVAALSFEVPEPSTIAIFGIALIALGLRFARKS